jgi:hypothetical protein
MATVSYTVVTGPTTETPRPHPEVRWTQVAKAPDGSEEWLVTTHRRNAARLLEILKRSPQVIGYRTTKGAKQ